jgi:hypothetical protein
MAIEGLDEVLRNLNKEVKGIKSRTLAGFVSAALFTKSRSQRECPVVESNLKNSAFIVASDGSVPGGMSTHLKVRADIAMDDISVAIGYSAVYAAAVHENPRAGQTEGMSPSGKKYTAGLTGSGKKSKRKVFSTVGKWKFLEEPLKNNAKKILSIIAKKAKIK